MCNKILYGIWSKDCKFVECKECNKYKFFFIETWLQIDASLNMAKTLFFLFLINTVVLVLSQSTPAMPP